MASKKKTVAKAALAAKAVPFSAADLANLQKANPYIQRLIEDASLRDNLTTALDSSRRAYDRLSSSKAPHKAVIDDKKLQKEIRTAGEAVRDAVQSLADAPNKPKKKKRRLGRTLLILVLGAGVALAVSESLRSKVLDALFGSEEEFQYTPPAPSPTTPPASPVTAA